MNTIKKWTVIIGVCFSIGIFLGVSFYNAALKESETKLENKRKLSEEWKVIEERPVKVYKGKWEMGGITLTR